MTRSTGVAACGATEGGAAELGEAEAWQVLRATIAGRSGLALDGAPGAAPPAIAVDPESPAGWRPVRPISAAAERLLDLFMPLCVNAGARRLVLAHLGQSLDGRVATVTGASQFITGKEDLQHTHRLRALFDAVLVGANTVARDDPRLTTRLVCGTTPARVVLDPQARLSPALFVLSDSSATTWLVVARGARPKRELLKRAHVRIVEVDSDGGVLDLAQVLEELAGHGLRRVFVEGGGITVSHFLQRGLLDRLHVAVAATIIGSGRPALTLPPIDQLAERVPLRCRRFMLGDDVLFDCDLRAASE